MGFDVCFEGVATFELGFGVRGLQILEGGDTASTFIELRFGDESEVGNRPNWLGAGSV